MHQKVEDECAVLLAIKLLGRKWVPFVLCELLSQQELYFSDIRERIIGNYGERISARVLSKCLTRLEKNNLIQRTVISETMPIRVKYSLTEKGKDLRVVLGVLKGWGIKWGGISQKKCQSFTCIHNSVAMIDINKAAKLLEIKETASPSSDSEA